MNTCGCPYYSWITGSVAWDITSHSAIVCLYSNTAWQEGVAIGILGAGGWLQPTRTTYKQYGLGGAVYSGGLVFSGGWRQPRCSFQPVRVGRTFGGVPCCNACPAHHTAGACRPCRACHSTAPPAAHHPTYHPTHYGGSQFHYNTFDSAWLEVVPLGCAVPGWSWEEEEEGERF